MPVTIPSVTLVDVERKDLREMSFRYSLDCTGMEDDVVCEDVWYVQLTYVVLTDTGEVYKTSHHKVEVWPTLLSLMLPAVDEVVIKANIVEGM